MTLLFTSPPPKFSKKDVLILIKNEYSMDGMISNCESDRDQNFLLTTNDGKYLFKIYNNHEHLYNIKINKNLYLGTTGDGFISLKNQNTVDTNKNRLKFLNENNQNT